MPETSDDRLAPPAPPVATRGSARLTAGRWDLRLLCTLEARNGDVVLTHFVSQPIGALLAALALSPDRAHPREELVERLWPGVDLPVGRNRLRNAISSLRRLLEPPGVASGSVLVADRQSVRLAPDASRCDALEFERALRAGDAEHARSLYRGELLPGYYDDWIHDERARLAALRERIADEPNAASRAGTTAADAGPAEPNAAELPAGWSVSAPPLPSYLTSCFGRDRERADVLTLIATHRLVTVSGTGGCGKTRLAVEVAQSVGGFDAVAFAALADCREPEQLIAQVRVALQLPQLAGNPLDQVVALARERRTFIVLDNFEQLVPGGGVAVVAALLERAPALHLLVTSRRILGLDGEHEFALRPLPLPLPEGSVEQIAASPSVSLFVDRARSVRPDFQVTARNHAALAVLCRALEGLPLAIELAASRSRAFSPADMHAALAQRFSLLARGPARLGHTGGRHDSLRGAIDWSWLLLSASQQRFLLALSVFRGGWSADSAQAVSDEPQAHAQLESLAADSLLRSEVDANGALRFFMYEMIREYLQERIPAADAPLLRQRHRAHFLARGMARGQRSQAAAREDLPNFVEALRTAVDDGEPLLALALGVALRGEWEQHGMADVVAGLLERALENHALAGAAQGGAQAVRMQAHLVLRSALIVAGRCEAAQVHATRALELAGNQPGLRAAALLGQGRQHWERARDAAQVRPLLDEALALARQERAAETEAGVLATRATITFHVDNQPDAAIALFDNAQRLYESQGIDHLANRNLFMKAICHAKLQRYAAALSLLDDCERRFTASGHAAALPELANMQGFVYAYMVRWRDAELAFARCAVVAAGQQNRYMMGFGLWNLARPLAHRRQPEAAARLLAFSERYWVANFDALVPSDRRYLEQVKRLVRVQIGAAALDDAWAAGATLTLPVALEMAAQSLRATG